MLLEKLRSLAGWSGAAAAPLPGQCALRPQRARVRGNEARKRRAARAQPDRAGGARLSDRRRGRAQSRAGTRQATALSLSGRIPC
jgi:hypothetical protein